VNAFPAKSLAVTTIVLAPLLRAIPVAVQESPVIVTEPIPAELETETDATPTLSLTIPLTVTGEEPTVAGKVVNICDDRKPSAGAVMLEIETIGGVVSCTVTVNDAVLVLPAASVAVHITVVVPNEKVEPEAGEHVTGIEPSKLSVAVAVYATVAPAGDVASAVIGAGTVIDGGVASCVVMV